MCRQPTCGSQQRKRFAVPWALRLIIVARDLPSSSRQRGARLSDQLRALFIEVDLRACRIIRLSVEIQHVFHTSDERGTYFRGCTIVSAARLEFVFFRYRRTVSCESDADNPNSTTLSASRRSVHRCRPPGAWLQATAIRCAVALSSSFPALSWAGTFGQTTEVLLDEALAGALNRRYARTDGFRNLCIVQTVIGLEQNACPRDLAHGSFALRSKRFNSSRSSAVSSTMYFFTVQFGSSQLR